MKEDRWPRRHPLCTCPEWAPDFKGTPPPDRRECQGGTIAHPVIGIEEINRIIEQKKEELKWNGASE